MGKPPAVIPRTSPDRKNDRAALTVQRRNILEWWEYFSGFSFEQARRVYDPFAADWPNRVATAEGAGAAALVNIIYSGDYRENFYVPAGDKAFPLKHPLK